MKKIVLLIIAYLFVNIAKADEFPCVSYISSKDSTVWVLVGTNGGHVTYRIDFDKSGRIAWEEEKDTLVCNNMEKWNSDTWKDTQSAEKRWNLFDKDGYFWQIGGYQLFCTNRIEYQLPKSHDGILHIGDDGKVWWGTYCFIGYYQKCPNFEYDNFLYGEGVRIFFIDEYTAQGTGIYLCTEEEDCPEPEPAPDSNDYDNPEDYNLALSEYEAIDGGDGYPTSLCFCDGRKIGYIKDSDGFVNFRTAPSISAPIIGIILDRVRVFYWDNEDNGDWYKVEINNVMGYVHRSRIRRN